MLRILIRWHAYSFYLGAQKMIRCYRGAGWVSSVSSTVALCILVAFAFQASAFAQKPQFTVEETLNKYALACDAIRTYEVEVLSETFYGVKDADPPKTLLPTHARRTTQLFSRGHFRSDLRDNNGTKLNVGDLAWCWDGEKATSINKESGEAVTDTGDGVAESIQNTGYSLLYRDFIPAFSFIKQIETRGVTGTTLSVVEGLPVLTTAATEKPVSFNSVAFRLTLDPNRSYLPARIEKLLKLPGREELFVWENLTIEHRQTGDGLWVPSQGIRRTFKAPRDATGPTQIGLERITIDFENAKVNHDLPQSRCAIQIPPNMRILRQ